MSAIIRRVRRDGVHVDGRVFWHPKLDVYKGRLVEVRFAGEVSRFIDVFNASTGTCIISNLAAASPKGRHRRGESLRFLSDDELADMPKAYLLYEAHMGRISPNRLDRVLNARRGKE